MSCAKKNVNLKSSQITKIDSISNLKELQDFVKTVDSSLIGFICIPPHEYKKVELANSTLKQQLDSLIPKTDYIKADFDGNGLNDLVITGTSNFSFNALAILDQGANNYKVLSLVPSHSIEQFPIYTKLLQKNDLSLVEIYRKNSVFGGKEFIKSTMVFKSGSFIEYVERTADYQIEKIEFGTTGCFGTCPVFDLILFPREKSKFHAKYYNFKNTPQNEDKEEGVFETVLNPSDFEAIVKLMNEVNIKELENSYKVGWTDDQTSVLKVYFSDGSFKFIQDYGMRGTLGLQLLYEKLLALRFNQDWKPL
ncbi:DUF6438 domain-containing protein [Winogradskyella sp. D23]|uniref:DUF6438 domain-containing protein n=1 Tax=Winogradskyella alexanderae TaxID=2877123 RepID=A0ABS7XPT0_9FLAO|nr:DUF6438 domain-containing protein [Winogradskyella alexanderae]